MVNLQPSARPTPSNTRQGKQPNSSQALSIFGGAFLLGSFSRSSVRIFGQRPTGRSIDRMTAGQLDHITPAGFGLVAAQSIDGFAARGSNELWFALGPTLSSIVVVHSTDGGQRWSRGQLPSCPASTCSVALSFTSAANGLALVASSSYSATSELFRTSDGGAHWQRVARPPFADSLAMSGEQVGWGTADVRVANAGTVRARLFKSADAGRVWRSAATPGISGASVAWLGQPTFFAEARGVVPAVLSTGEFAVFITDDGGNTWRASPDPHLAVPARTAWINPPRFFAASPSVWSASRSSTLSMTTDAGASWSAVHAPPVYANNPPVFGFAMVSAATGWIDAYSEACSPRSTTQPCGSLPLLLRTSDGGATWTPLREPRRSA
jgi:photosystem II stability/assembly factor-like uncharacterized protein